MLSNNNQKKNIKVCVTGASGFIASHVIKDLLTEGYTVHGTVRTIGGKSSEHLTVENLCPNGAPGELKLFSADLLKEGSFDEAIDGCDIVMHMASPFVVGKVKDVHAQLLDPALKGTENVLNSASKYDSVKRVVLTSSIVAVYGHNNDKIGAPYNEADWNTTSSETESAYSYSKVIAEKRAWELEKSASWDMVTINPGFVVGPTLSGRGNDGTFGFMKQILSMPAAPNFAFGCVDVRDVARAHRLAFENKNASGRHILVESPYTFMEMGKLIREHHPGYSSPKYVVPKPIVWLFAPLLGQSRTFVANNANCELKIDSTKGKQLLGNKMYPMSETFRDTIESMIDHGMIKRK